MKIINKLKFKPKAIICDMDGVIVDSMPYHFLAWYEALRPLGISVRCFDVYIASVFLSLISPLGVPASISLPLTGASGLSLRLITSLMFELS